MDAFELADKLRASFVIIHEGDFHNGSKFVEVDLMNQYTRQLIYIQERDRGCRASGSSLSEAMAEMSKLIAGKTLWNFAVDGDPVSLQGPEKLEIPKALLS